MKHRLNVSAKFSGRPAILPPRNHETTATRSARKSPSVQAELVQESSGQIEEEHWHRMTCDSLSGVTRGNSQRRLLDAYRVVESKLSRDTTHVFARLLGDGLFEPSLKGLRRS
jgi:hypothetical protein